MAKLKHVLNESEKISQILDGRESGAASATSVAGLRFAALS